MAELPSYFIVADEPMVINKIDDTTVEFQFAGPYSLLPSLLAFRGREWLRPSHYLSQFHPDHADADELAAMVAEAGFEDWFQLYQDKNEEFLNADRPTMRAWDITQAYPADRLVAERNPYYWKVDTAGNQLPYIDNIHADLLSDAQVITLRAASGGIDFQYRHMAFSSAALLIDGQEEGNYRMLRWTPGGGWFALYMNQSHTDPVVRDLMQNDDFRQAMSVAIDRGEMNQLLYNGIGTAQQVTASPLDPYHIPGAGERWLEYDPDLANELLDSVGLDERDSAGFRLRPDGERFRLSILTYPFETGASSADAYELVTKYWQAVGVDASFDLVERSLWTTRALANEADVIGYTSAGTLWEIDPVWFALTASSSYMAPGYGVWYQTLGAQGEEPPPELRRLQQAYDELKVTVDPDARLALGQEIIRAHDENKLDHRHRQAAVPARRREQRPGQRGGGRRRQLPAAARGPDLVRAARLRQPRGSLEPDPSGVRTACRPNTDHPNTRQGSLNRLPWPNTPRGAGSAWPSPHGKGCHD